MLTRQFVRASYPDQEPGRSRMILVLRPGLGLQLKVGHHLEWSWSLTLSSPGRQGPLPGWLASPSAESFPTWRLACTKAASPGRTGYWRFPANVLPWVWTTQMGQVWGWEHTSTFSCMETPAKRNIPRWYYNTARAQNCGFWLPITFFVVDLLFIYFLHDFFPSVIIVQIWQIYFSGHVRADF